MVIDMVKNVIANSLLISLLYIYIYIYKKFTIINYFHIIYNYIN